MHSSLSADARDSLDKMVAAAVDRGLKYVAITDHGQDLAINGATRQQLLAQRKRIARLQEQHPKMTILQGAELNIGPDGSIDYDAEFLAGLDFGVASVHSSFNLSREKQTARVIAAMHNPAVNVIGHLTGRRIAKRPGIDLDTDAVLEAATETGCAIEINGHLDRLDAPVEVLRHARGRNVVFAISSDAHDTWSWPTLRTESATPAAAGWRRAAWLTHQRSSWRG